MYVWNIKFIEFQISSFNSNEQNIKKKHQKIKYSVKVLIALKKLKINNMILLK